MDGSSSINYLPELILPTSTKRKAHIKLFKHILGFSNRKKSSSKFLMKKIRDVCVKQLQQWRTSQGRRKVVVSGMPNLAMTSLLTYCVSAMTIFAVFMHLKYLLIDFVGILIKSTQMRREFSAVFVYLTFVPNSV